MTTLGALGLGLFIYSQNMLSPPPIPKTEGEDFSAPVTALENTRVQKVSAVTLLQEIGSARNKVTIVNLWATWCGPCKEEIPALVELQKKYGGKSLQVRLVSVDGLDLIKEVHHTLAELNVDFLSYIRTDDDQVFIEKIYPGWSGALPASIVYDKSGKILESWMGTRSLAEFESIVKKYL